MARSTDAPGIHEIYAPIVAETAISFELEVPSIDELAQRVTTLLERYPWLVAEDGGRVTGYAYGSAHRSRAAYGWSTDASLYVHPDAHRQGLGRALYAALFDLLGRQGFTQVFAGIALPNAASEGLHEAVGFTPVGVYRAVGWKLGRWHDVAWWQRPLHPPTPPEPRAPRAFPDLAAEEVDEALQAGGTLLRPRASR